jgi:tRNA-modifying protein YgfZ
MMDPAQQAVYEIARNRAAFRQILEGGCLRIEGEDRLAFLQRQTTNDAGKLAPGRGVLTVLTSATARILDVLYLLPEERAVSVHTLPGRGAATLRFLRSRIFFNDKVSISDLSPATIQIDLFGPEAGRVLETMGVASPPAVDQVVDLPMQALTVRLARLPSQFGLGYRLVSPLEAAQPLQQTLEQAGAVLVDADVFEVLRIEAGLPASGNELNETYTPLEAGLQVAISGSKGCYTGQEVIARQITYDKVTQHLCGLRLEAPASAGSRLYTAAGDPVGTITSAAVSPRLGPLGLAILKRPHHEPGTDLRVGSPQGSRGVTTALPFA